MPNRRRQSPKESPLEKLSQSATRWSGGSAAFAVAFGIVVLWLVTGPLLRLSSLGREKPIGCSILEAFYSVWATARSKP